MILLYTSNRCSNIFFAIIWHEGISYFHVKTEEIMTTTLSFKFGPTVVLFVVWPFCIFWGDFKNASRSHTLKGYCMSIFMKFRVDLGLI